jgi:hypothetical protein
MLLFTSGWILYHLVMIKIYGSVTVSEKSGFLLVLESFIIFLFVLYALIKVIEDIGDE